MTILLAALLLQDAPREKTSRFTLESGRLVLPGPILFRPGSADLLKESEPVLWVIADFLEAKPSITRLRIEGHADDGAPPDAAQALTEGRALAVARWLVAKGADPKRLIAAGFGSSKPLVPNDTPENKATNRRIEVRPAELLGRAIGGLPLDGGGKVAGDPAPK